MHVVVERLTDLSGLLGSVGERDGGFSLPYGRGDEAMQAGAQDPLEQGSAGA